MITIAPYVDIAVIDVVAYAMGVVGGGLPINVIDVEKVRWSG